jgi:cytochrome c
MKIKARAAIVIITGFIIAITYQSIAIAAIDAPHNASNNISCGSCHGAALLNSPFWGGSYTPVNIDDTSL